MTGRTSRAAIESAMSSPRPLAIARFDFNPSRNRVRPRSPHFLHHRGLHHRPLHPSSQGSERVVNRCDDIPVCGCWWAFTHNEFPGNSRHSLLQLSQVGTNTGKSQNQNIAAGEGEIVFLGFASLGVGIKRKVHAPGIDNQRTECDLHTMPKVLAQFELRKATDAVDPGRLTELI